MRELQLFVDGAFVDAAYGETFETTNPSTGEVVASVALGDGEDVSRAVAAARRAFDEGPWPGMTPAARAGLMRTAFERMAGRAEEIAAWRAPTPATRSGCRRCSRSPMRTSSGGT